MLTWQPRYYNLVTGGDEKMLSKITWDIVFITCHFSNCTEVVVTRRAREKIAKNKINY